MRKGNGKAKLYYDYTDEQFTKVVTGPKILFEFPDPNVQILDADITPTAEGRYCMTSVAQQNSGGVRNAFSKG